MDDPNITMEEYIRTEEEKAQKREKVFNWKAAKYDKIWYDEDVFDLKSVKTEFSAIVFNDNLTSNKTPSCEPTVSSLNNNEIDFRISFDESDDVDYTVVFDKNSFSYKIISTNDLKRDSENDNEKVNKPLFPSPEPSVSCIDDLDFFKDFKNEFPAIVYNDPLTSKLGFSIEPTLCSQHIDEFDFKDETSLSEYDEVEQNVLCYNDPFPFNIIYLDDLKYDKGDDDNEIDMTQSSRGNENTQGSNKLLEESHDKINKVFKIKSFVMELNVNIVSWNYLVNGMLFNLIKNLYVSFGIPFDPKRYYKDGDCTRMLRRPSTLRFGEALLDLDMVGALQFQLGGVRRRMSWREFILALGLHSAEEMQTASFGIPPPSYTLIRDPMLRLCHRLFTCSITRRSQAPEKVTVTGLFYLGGMDVGSVNVPYLLAMYLRLFASGRKHGAMISGGQFVARLPEDFGGGDEDEEMHQAVSPSPRTLDDVIVRLEEEVHGNYTIEVYYQKLKGFLDEFDALEALYMYVCACNCENGRVNGEGQRKRLIRFLMGLDEGYSNVRGQILLMQPLPSIAKAYTMVRQKEKQREGLTVKPTTSTIFNTYTNHSRPFMSFNNSAPRNKGHFQEECCKLVGYLVGHPLHGKYQPPKPTHKATRTVNLVGGQEDPKTQGSSSQATVQASDTHVLARIDQLQIKLIKFYSCYKTTKEMSLKIHEDGFMKTMVLSRLKKIENGRRQDLKSYNLCARDKMVQDRPAKYAFFIWRLERRRLPVYTWLDHLGMDLNSILVRIVEMILKRWTITSWSALGVGTGDTTEPIRKVIASAMAKETIDNNGTSCIFFKNSMGAVCRNSIGETLVVSNRRYPKIRNIKQCREASTTYVLKIMSRLKYPHVKVISVGTGDTTEPIRKVIASAMAKKPSTTTEPAASSLKTPCELYVETQLEKHWLDLTGAIPRFATSSSAEKPSTTTEPAASSLKTPWELYVETQLEKHWLYLTGAIPRFATSSSAEV
nr:hypothetical protein [Tanacetum cinerariifolium]